MLQQFNFCRVRAFAADLRSIFEFRQPYFSCAAFPGNFRLLFIEKYRQRIHAPVIQQRERSASDAQLPRRRNIKGREFPPFH